MSATYALNRAKSSKLAFEIMLVSAIVETRNDQSLECITADVGIIGGLVYRCCSRVSAGGREE